jgi:zinc/manganese transport system substrate-binding protein
VTRARSISSLLLAALLLAGPARADEPLKVVVTLPHLGDVVRRVGGDAVQVTVLVRPGADPHAVEVTPAHAQALREAEVLVQNGVQLEGWAARAVETSGNPRIQLDAPGHVYAATGCRPLEVPTAEQLAAGGHVHAAGNPHVWLDPLNLKVAAANVERALAAARPALAPRFKEAAQAFAAAIDEAYFGPELVKVLGAAQLERLQRSGRLVAFLKERRYRDKPLADLAGGWLKRGMELGGLQVVAYHRTWAFLEWAFGIRTVATVEERPGIPPSPAHLDRLTGAAKEAGARVVVCAPYEPLTRAEGVAERLGGVAVALPTQPGEGETSDIFGLYEKILILLADARRRTSG